MAATTIVPALLFLTIELLLRLFGFGHATAFFLRKSAPGRDIYVENLDFGRRFFPAGLAREPLPAAFPALKSRATCRIFILGESAAMGFPSSSFSFARILKVMLEDRCPGTRFEVINTAMTAINSHVILPIARDCAKHQPDLFVVYMGNNEVVGPFGSSGVLGPASQNLSLIRANIQVKSLRIGELMSTIQQRVFRRKETPRDWDGMSMFSDSHVRHDDPRLESVNAHFADNLREICEAGRRAGAKVVVCTVGSNLRHSPPFGSLPSQHVAGSLAMDWQRAFEEGVRRENGKDYAGAVGFYERAAEIDAHRADLHFRWARCLFAAEMPAQARRHFLLARDYDTLRFRADTRINSTIRAVVAACESESVLLADAEYALEQASPQELPGEEFFFEHVHLTFAGNYLLARAVFETLVNVLPASAGDSAMQAGEPLSEKECQSRLAYTDWSRLNAIQAIELLLRQPPFCDQIDAAERAQRTHRQVALIQENLQSEGRDHVVAEHRRAIECSEGDYVLRMDFAFLLMSMREFDEAAEQLLAIQRDLPHHPAPHVMLARVLASQFRLDEALVECNKALDLQPGWQQALDIERKIRLMRKAK